MQLLYTAFSAKERLALHKKLLACNTKLKRDRFIGYSENEAQLEAFVHPTKLIETFFCSVSLFLTYIVAVFPLTHLSFTPV